MLLLLVTARLWSTRTAGPIALSPLMRLESTQEEEKHDRIGALRLPEICAFGRSPICLAGKKGAGLRMSFGLTPSRDPDQTATHSYRKRTLFCARLRYFHNVSERSVVSASVFHGLDQVMVKTHFARLVTDFRPFPIRSTLTLNRF